MTLTQFRSLTDAERDLLASLDHVGFGRGWKPPASRASLDRLDFNRALARLVAAGLVTRGDASRCGWTG